jgi:hypothetical protein
MSELEAGLLVVVVLLTVVVLALVRAQASAAKRLAVLERRALRAERRTAPPTAVPPSPDPSQEVPMANQPPVEPVEPVAPVGSEEGDAVDVRGLTVAGEPTTVALERPSGPVLLAFLSTTCGICLGLWERLRDQGIDGVTPVVVTKDAAVEDLGRAQQMAAEGSLPVVMSSEAWDDYEVPGSPYFLLVDGTPGSVVAEGEANSWAAVGEIVPADLTH